MTRAATPELLCDGPIATITLRRPDQANRLELVDLECLESHVETLRTSPALRVLILQAQGAHFCSGFHIDAVPSVDAPALFERLCDRIETLPQISLAALQGGAWGGATDLALACDFRFGTDACQMAIPAARLGLHYYGGGMRRLVTRLGVGPAKRLLLAGQSLDAAAMRDCHFLDECLPSVEALRARVQDQAQTIASFAPLALSGMKRHLNTLAFGNLDREALEQDRQRCAQSTDLQEGVRAWQARRPPRFTGR